MEDTLLHFLNIYERLPRWLKRPIGRCYSALPARLKYGVFYHEFQKRIDYFLNLKNDKELMEAQKALLFPQVNSAIRRIPFYQKFAKVENWDDFHRLPIVTKTDYLRNREDFCSPDPAIRLRANTGGSSGTPLTFLGEKNKTRPKEKCMFDWFWGNWGYQPGARILMLRGKPLANNALFEYQTIKNCLNISCYELTTANSNAVLKEIQSFHPQFIHGYPSAVDVFIRCAGKISREPFSEIKALFLGRNSLTIISVCFLKLFLGLLRVLGMVIQNVHFLGGLCLVTTD